MIKIKRNSFSILVTLSLILGLIIATQINSVNEAELAKDPDGSIPNLVPDNLIQAKDPDGSIPNGLIVYTYEIQQKVM